MSGADPAEPDDGITLAEGEALAWLRTLPDASADALVTDPPYSSGGQFRGDRTATTRAKYIRHQTFTVRGDFAGDTRDQRGYLTWCALWLAEALRVCKPGAPAVLFTDWRQLPTTTDALQAGGWVWRGIAVWDKKEGARPQPGRYSAQAEYLVWGSRGPMPLARPVAPLPGVFRAAVRQADKFHQAGKPTDLMLQVLRIVEPGGLVLDPFLGSGSTALAARALGLRLAGVELDPRHLAIARRRLRQAPLPLAAAAAPETAPLFAEATA